MGAETGGLPPYAGTMRRGATLLELVLVLVIIGTLTAIAEPRVRGLADSLAVHRAALEIVSAHRRARISAILQSRVLELTISAAALSIRPRGTAADTWQAAGPAAERVALAGAEPRHLLLARRHLDGRIQRLVPPESRRRQPYRCRVPSRPGAHRALSARPLGWLGG
jgi:prepilin-type N-terminal cleavage/methylation domain-containing protein